MFCPGILWHNPVTMLTLIVIEILHVENSAL